LAGALDGDAPGERAGASPTSAAFTQTRAAEFVGDGLLEVSAGRWRVTARGWLVADFLAKKMMAEV
jgi:coproporphyrinogen III oxidase-like Fe-S oxidoreductase